MTEIPSNGPERRETAEIIEEAVSSVAEAINLYHETFVELRKAERSTNKLLVLASGSGAASSKERYQLPLAVYSEPSVMLNGHLRETNKNIRALTGKDPVYKFVFSETLGEMSLHGSGHRLTDQYFIADGIKADTGGFVKLKNSENRSVLILPPRAKFNLELTD